MDRIEDDWKAAIDLIWVDIQGHEGHLFEGARRFLAQSCVPVISEFWPYGIGRSGISPEEYVSRLSTMFSSFSVLGNADFQRAPMSDLAKLFEVYSGPRNFGLLVLAPMATDSLPSEAPRS